MFLALGVAGTLGPGCGDKSSGTSQKMAPKIAVATLGPGQESRLFPLKVGNQWNYVIEVQSFAAGGATRTSVGEMSMRVAKVENKQGSTIATIEVRDSNGRVGQSDIWEVSSKGIFQRTGGPKQIPFVPPQTNILFPLAPGKTFVWKGSGLVPTFAVGNSEIRGKVLSPQEVDGAVKRFSAFPVEIEGNFVENSRKGELFATAYWSPDVGLVRYRQEVRSPNAAWVQVIKLKAYVLK